MKVGLRPGYEQILNLLLIGHNLIMIWIWLKNNGWSFNEIMTVVQGLNVEMLYLICFNICFVFSCRLKWLQKEEYDSEDGKSRSSLRQGNSFTATFHDFINLLCIYFNQGCVMDWVLNVYSCWFHVTRLLEWGVLSLLLPFLFMFCTYGLLCNCIIASSRENWTNVVISFSSLTEANFVLTDWIYRWKLRSAGFWAQQEYQLVFLFIYKHVCLLWWDFHHIGFNSLPVAGD